MQAIEIELRAMSGACDPGLGAGGGGGAGGKGDTGDRRADGHPSVGGAPRHGEVDRTNTTTRLGTRQLISRLGPGQDRFLKFLVVGGSGVPVNLGCVSLTAFLLPASLVVGVRDAIAYAVGIFVSILTNFVLNNAWTWADRAASAGSFAARLAKFYLVSAISAAVQLVTSVSLSHVLRGNGLLTSQLHGELRLYHLAAPMAGILLGLAINFTANHFWTFRRRS